MYYIDHFYDHSLTLWKDDPILPTLNSDPIISKMKLNIVDFIPTAENLAAYLV